MTPFAADRANTAVPGGPVVGQFIEGNTVFQMKVNPGWTFHNGETFDAEQLKWNFDRVLGRAEYNPDFVGAYVGNFPGLGDVVVADATTVRVEMGQPNAGLPEAMNHGIKLVPKGYVTSQGDQVLAREPVGSGPFKFESWVPDQEIISVRNDDFVVTREADHFPRMPYVARTVSKLIPEEQARLAALEAGEIDFAVNISADLSKQFDDRRGFRVFYHSAQRGLHFQLPLYADKEPIHGGPNLWRDKRVRTAANLAIDVDTIIKTLQTGREAHTYPLAEGQFGFPESLRSQRWGFEPDRAKSLLAEAGAEGFEFDLTYGRGLYTGDRAFVEAAAAMLRDVGFKVNVVEFGDTANYFVEARTGKIPGPFLYPQPAGLHPITALQTVVHSQSGATHPADSIDAFGADIDRRIDQVSAEFDLERQRQLLEGIATDHYLNASWIYLFELVQPHVASDRVEWDIYANKPSAPETWNMRVVAG